MVPTVVRGTRRLCSSNRATPRAHAGVAADPQAGAPPVQKVCRSFAFGRLFRSATELNYTTGTSMAAESRGCCSCSTARPRPTLAAEDERSSNDRIRKKENSVMAGAGDAHGGKPPALQSRRPFTSTVTWAPESIGGKLLLGHTQHDKTNRTRATHRKPLFNGILYPLPP